MAAAGDEIALPPPPRRSTLAIAMVCDFVYPRLGGVEMHIYSLSQCLLKQGYKVIIVSNTYTSNNGKRVGVRHMTNGLKVYYMPVIALVDQATMPSYYAFFPLFRKILLRERIDIVHGHSATSPLMHECLLQAKAMGYKCIFTDHSLFGFADAASINVNKYLKFTLSNIDHCICVSHTDRENLVLRAALDPRMVSTIPNAVDASKFTPNPAARPTTKQVNIVMLSRLVYRKGVDLVVNVIPAVCDRFPNVHFIIGGDGPKRLLLEEMRERHQLHDRVELIGAVSHKNVRDVLTRGHIFLNCSLTEAFCIAILEAACCGCFVVSTAVGGVPEVLPHHMIRFAEPDPESIVGAITHAIPLVHTVVPSEFHRQLREMYNWPEVAHRTATVYERVAAEPHVPLVERFRRFYGVGRVFGIIAVIAMALFHFMFTLLELVAPAADVDIVPDLRYEDVDKVETPESLRRDYLAVARPHAVVPPMASHLPAASLSPPPIPTGAPIECAQPATGLVVGGGRAASRTGSDVSGFVDGGEGGSDGVAAGIATRPSPGAVALRLLAAQAARFAGHRRGTAAAPGAAGSVKGSPGGGPLTPAMSTASSAVSRATHVVRVAASAPAPASPASGAPPLVAQAAAAAGAAARAGPGVHVSTVGAAAAGGDSVGRASPAGIGAPAHRDPGGEDADAVNRMGRSTSELSAASSASGASTSTPLASPDSSPTLPARGGGVAGVGDADAGFVVPPPRRLPQRRGRTAGPGKQPSGLRFGGRHGDVAFAAISPVAEGAEDATPQATLGASAAGGTGLYESQLSYVNLASLAAEGYGDEEGAASPARRRVGDAAHSAPPAVSRAGSSGSAVDLATGSQESDERSDASPMHRLSSDGSTMSGELDGGGMPLPTPSPSAELGGGAISTSAATAGMLAGVSNPRSRWRAAGAPAAAAAAGTVAAPASAFETLRIRTSTRPTAQTASDGTIQATPMAAASADREDDDDGYAYVPQFSGLHLSLSTPLYASRGLGDGAAALPTGGVPSTSSSRWSRMSTPSIATPAGASSGGGGGGGGDGDGDGSGAGEAGR